MTCPVKRTRRVRLESRWLHQSLLRGKLPRSLHWSDVVDLIGHLGLVQANGGDEFAFVVGTRREVFKRPHTPEMGVEDVSRLRRFLKLAESELPADKFIQPRRMIVVIDHCAAHIFSVVASLVSADEIVLVGHGTGKSSAMSALEEHLNRHHVDLSRRVKATEIIDLSALTEHEIEAIAKRHMIAVVSLYRSSTQRAAGRKSLIISWDGSVLRCRVVSQVEEHLVHVTPAPAFGRIITLDDQVTGCVIMTGRMTARRLIATTNVSASPADSEVKPFATGFQTFLATARTWSDLSDGAQMCAAFAHDWSLEECRSRIFARICSKLRT